MNIAYFDCFSGVSGDMILGALVDAGLDSRHLEKALDGLGIKGFELTFHKETQGYLAGTRAEVKTAEGPKERHLPEILEIIRKASLSERVKSQAGSIFERLAEAEAAVHGIPPEKVHFHEVGALDAIVDIIGAVAGLELLQVDQVFASPLPLGKGFVECRHGRLPVPAPAVVNLVKNYEVRLTGIERELTTPTGAAIITTLANKAALPPPFAMESAGYGFGSRPGGDLPNALRFMKGTLSGGRLEEVVLLQTNLDDVTGETVGHLLERSFEEGALDAFAIPVQMKKSRPGVVFSVLARPDRMDDILRLVHSESGSLGIRIQRMQRSVLPREVTTMDTSLGPVRVKESRIPGWPPSLSPEYDDVARIARERKMPLRLVLETIMAEIAGRKK